MSQEPSNRINEELIRAEYDLSHSDALAAKSMLESTFAQEDLEGLI